MRSPLWSLSFAFMTGLGAQSVATAQTAPSVEEAPTDDTPAFDAPVSASSLLGTDLERHHFDDDGFPESETGQLVTEVDEEVGPIIVMQGDRPHYLEAQFTNRQRDGVFLSRTGERKDPLPNGSSFTIPYGHGALKMSMNAVTLIEGQLKPHISDNQKSHELFPLTDLYLGGTVALTGLSGDIRYVQTERYVGYGQVGFNPLAMAGARINNTFGAFGANLTLGGGYRYPTPLDFLGTHWTSGGEVKFGLFAADDDPSTNAFIFLPGVVQEFEWTLERPLDIVDYRTDPRPSNWGLHSIFGKIGVYADFASGDGGSKGILFDLSVGYRFNGLMGPQIPPHTFKQTEVTYASERYVNRKKEEAERQRQLEELMKRRREKGP